MRAVFTKDFLGYLNSLLGYLIIILFLLTTSVLNWWFPSTSILEYGFADMNTFFSTTPYIFIFLLPALTMRLLAEEFKTQTIELLLTKPVSIRAIVWGKFWAMCGILVVILVPTLIYFFSVYALGNPKGNIDSAATVGSYVGLYCVGCLFGAIGLFSSSLTNSQVFAFVLGTFLCGLFYLGFSALADMFPASSMGNFLEQFDIENHYNSLGRGVLDSRNLIFILGFIIVLVELTAVRIRILHK